MRLVLLSLLLAYTTLGSAMSDSPARAQAESLVGTQAKRWALGPEWSGSKPLTLRELRGRVVVIRFWTDTCDFCAASLPALQKLADEFRDAPVTFVGAYHSKPRGSEKPWSVAVARAKDLGVKFPIAYDHEWRTVTAWWLADRGRAATSATFVIGPDGRILHVHPGPIFFSSGHPKDAKPNADYEAIRDTIQKAASRAATPKPSR